MKNYLLPHPWYSAAFKRDQKTRRAEKKPDFGNKATVRKGWSYQQLASTLNLPSGAVISNLRRARQRLQQEF